MAVMIGHRHGRSAPPGTGSADVALVVAAAVGLEVVCADASDDRT
jgi:hypothetical protein